MTNFMKEMTKTRMLELVTTKRAEFEALLSQLSERQKVGIQIEHGWTVKDVIAHVTAWEAELLSWLQSAAKGAKPNIPTFTEDYVNGFNDRIYQENRERSYMEVFSDFQQVYHELLTALNNLPDEQDALQWTLWRNGEPPWLLIAGNTYDHYKDHFVPIEALLKRD
jgi:hypothetical protein